MPKVKCNYCGRYSYGWALLHKSCHCECGNFLRKEDIENI